MKEKTRLILLFTIFLPIFIGMTFIIWVHNDNGFFETIKSEYKRIREIMKDEQ